MSDDVSRETPPVPDEAQGAFAPSALASLTDYVGWLADAGVVRGLIGPREAPRLWERHVLNCAAVADAVPLSVSVADLGSGAGLPGVVLAVIRPDLHLTLVEPLERRTRFLDDVVDDLGIENVEVVRARADALHGARTFDVVTARALAGLERLLPWAMPLVAPTGALLAMKGERAGAEIAALGRLVDSWGLAPPQVQTVGTGLSTATLVRVTWSDPGRVSWPLAAGPAGAGRGDRRDPGAGRSRRPAHRGQVRREARPR